MRTHPNRLLRPADGFTLVELMITILIFGVVLAVVSGIFISSSRLYGETTERAGQQMSARVGVSLIATELRTAGCDPGQRGIVAITTASSDSARVQADYDGDGAIETVEPSEDVTYYWQADEQTLMRDPGTGPQVMLRNVTALEFHYFDEAAAELTPPLTVEQRGLIRSIGITMTTQTRRGGEVASSTRVTLRND